MGTGRSESRVRMEAGARGGHEKREKPFLRIWEVIAGVARLPLVGDELPPEFGANRAVTVDSSGPSHGRHRDTEEDLHG